MIQVNGQEMIFGTWFTIKNEGTAVIDVPSIPGHSIRFEIEQWTREPAVPKTPMDITDRMNWEQDYKVAIVDREIRLSMPYLLEYKSDPREFSFDLARIGKVTTHVIRQQVLGAMIVHIAMYLDRTQSAPATKTT